MNRKFLSLSFVLLIIVFNMFVFADFPKSHAKYVKEETESVVYTTSIKKLKLSTGAGNDYTTKDNVSLLSESVRDHAVFTIKFNRSNSMYVDSNGLYSDKLDTYKFVVKDNVNACYIRNNSVNSLYGNITYDNSKQFTITYNNTIADTVSLILECSVVDDELIDNSTDNIYVAFDILESITNYNNIKEEEFTYLEYGYPLVLNDYYAAVDEWHPVVIPDEPIDERSIYEKAISALEEKYSNVDDLTMGELKEYFDSIFGDSSSNDELFVENKNNLKGFTYDSSLNDPYIFSDNFLGYALTNVRYSKLVDKTKYSFYFSNVSELSIEDRKSIFDEYFNSYASDTLKESENSEKIINYINSYIEDTTSVLEGFAKMFEGSVFGISAVTMDDMLTLSFSDAILTIIDNNSLDPELFSSADTVTLVNKDKNADEMYIEFKQILYKMKNNDDTLVTQNITNLFNQFTSTNDPYYLRKIITLNSTDTSTTTIYGYFYVLDTDKLTNFYSDSTNTYVKFTKIEHNKSILLALPTNKTTYNMTLTDVINYIDRLLENDIQITSWPSVYDTQIDDDGITHRYYVVNGVTYDFFTKDEIDYVRYTTK